MNPGFAKFTDATIRNIADKIEGIAIHEMNIQPDHAHLIMTIPPKYAVAKVIEIIKSRSAKIVRQKFPWLNH